MNLTRKYLRDYCRGHRIVIPLELEKELLAFFRDDDEEYEYTEQDICEQLRKRLSPYALYGGAIAKARMIEEINSWGSTPSPEV
jgi:hypothetical protein